MVTIFDNAEYNSIIQECSHGQCCTSEVGELELKKLQRETVSWKDHEGPRRLL